MKYIWALILFGTLAISLLTNVLFAPKANLASLISLELLTEPVLIKENGREVLIAKIYSTYPFNSRNLITLNAGNQHGLKEGMPVTADGKLLLGSIQEVLEDLSIARTIFDKDFSLSVRIGEKAINALLAGGQTPRLTLVEKSAEIHSGDIVYSATRGFPYGMKIGEIGQIKIAASGAFKEAELLLPYQITDLREAAIIIK